MAVNRIKGAFAAPRKGETFELRAGLVYETPKVYNSSIVQDMTDACQQLAIRI